MDNETKAGRLASHLPGEYADNVAEVMRLRAARIRKLGRAGLTRRQIWEATGWTRRQQEYALRSYPDGTRAA